MSTARLDQALRLDALSRLAGGVAHELNNMLMVIENYAAFIAEDSPAGSQVHTDAEEIRTAVARGASLAGQLLAFGRREGGERAPLDVAAALTSLEPRLREQLPDGIELSVKLAGGLSAVDAEPRRLEDILDQLVRNAGEAIEGAGSVAIELSMFDVDDAYAAEYPELLAGPHLAISVSDNGVGMDGAVRERIFDPFFTTHSDEQPRGFGLAIVHGVIAAWGGGVDVQSQPGQGTVVRVLLPASATEPYVSRGPGDPAPADRSSGGYRVLLCEDDEAVRSLCTRVLERAGYEVLVAEDGSEGLRALATEAEGGRTIDLLLSDIVMPGVSGLEVAVAARERSPAIRVALMSGYHHKLVASEVSAIEGVAMLDKPIAGNELLVRMRDLLGRSPDAGD